MKRSAWIGLIVLALLLYGAFLIVFAPATYFVKTVNSLGAGTLALQQPTGTFWNGGADATISRGTAAPIVGQLHWTIHPSRLFVGVVGVDLRFDGAEVQMQTALDFGLRHHTLKNTTVVAPTSIAGLFYPPADFMELSGQFRLAIPAVEISKTGVSGSAELLWNNAASRLLPLQPAGDYKLQINAQETRADLRLSTLQGMLQVNGQGEWRFIGDGALRVQGNIATTSPQPTLDPLLNTIAPVQPDGKHAFTSEVRLRPLQPAALFIF